jgi:ribonucleoside-diphosphate reductase alpha subunit
MQVRKRNGAYEEVSFDKILTRIQTLGQEVNLEMNYSELTMKIIQQLHNNIETSRLDELTADQCAIMSTLHYNYSILASRIIVSNFQKMCSHSFLKTTELLYRNHDLRRSIVSEEYYRFVMKYHDVIETWLVQERDFLIDYFGFKTLEQSYLTKVNQVIVEPIQHMWMRIAIGIHMTEEEQNEGHALNLICETYDLLSQKYFTHATPTLFNAGTNNPQMSSCFLVGMQDDSIKGIYQTLGDCAEISKHAGGIGLHIHNIRAYGSYIHGTNGISNGIVPMLRVFNNTARYVDQGGNKRLGSFAIYLEPWHPDIEDFLEMKKNHGVDDTKARDLFYGLWICDLFMQRVKSNSEWSLFCPNECPGLSDVYGESFVELYTSYETAGQARKTISARDLWFRILDSQMETGTPYLLYKDAVNAKTNQQNLGVIKSSNLCCEVMQYSDKDETAVCNLASIALPMYVDQKTHEFDYQKLHAVAKVVTNNLNAVIDKNYYPTERCRISNTLHRPIGIGVQGLADVFMLMNIAFESEAAKEVNKLIFETIYHAALEKSYEISRRIYDNQPDKENKFIGAYSTFCGSPMSRGLFQFDMWHIEPCSQRFDWSGLRALIMQYGIRNSLLVAPMPTASTSQILGFNECFEPFTSNIYTRQTLAGEFIIVNKYLMRELIDMGHWNEDVKNNIIEHKGSVAQLDFLTEEMKCKYKTVWEIPMKHIIDMAADRGVYICQSQSMNLWLENPTYTNLTNMHFYAWQKGLKTGMYYLRRKAKHQAQQFTIEPKQQQVVDSTNISACDLCSA